MCDPHRIKKLSQSVPVRDRDHCGKRVMLVVDLDNRLGDTVCRGLAIPRNLCRNCSPVIRKCNAISTDSTRQKIQLEADFRT